MAIITGTISDDILFTTAAADDVTALDGNDIILIAAAADYAPGERLNGGAGFDRLWFTSTTADDSLVLAATATDLEFILIGDAVGNTTGTVDLNVDASLLGIGVFLIGNDGDNILVGTARNDTIIGNGGADTITGGAGNDRIAMQLASLDTADAGLQSEGNTLALAGSAAGTVEIDLRVVGGGDQLLFIDGVGEALVQAGFSHVDASAVTDAGVSIIGSSGVNILIGTGEDDILEGGAGADILVGGIGDDVFLVGTGTDLASTEVISGGAGTADVLRFTSLTAGQTMTIGAAATGLELVEIADATGDTTGTTALNVSAAAVKSGATPTAGLTLTGNDGANTITGTAFNDVINGNGGADSLSGGAGNDYYVIDTGSDGVPGDRITDSAGTGDFIFFTSTTNLDVLTLGATVTGIETVYLSDVDKDLGGTETIGVDAAAVTTAMTVLGNDGANAITGTNLGDTITGGGGSDTILARGGADTVVMGVEAASLDAADGGDAAEGNTLRLTGNAAGLIVINLATAANADQLLTINGVAEGLVQSDFTHVDADQVSVAAVNVTGSALANTIIGTDLDDTLQGGLGADILKGGTGSDLFIVTSSTEYSGAEQVDGGGGTDVLRFTSAIANQTLTLNALAIGLEEAEISDAAGDNSGVTALKLNAAAVKSAMILTGNDGINTITGTAFADTLTGNGGADVLSGGAGNDTYVVAAAADMVGDRINDTGGTDTVKFTSTTPGDTLLITSALSGIEVFEMEAAATDAINFDAHLLSYGAKFNGNAGANAITGTSKDDTIEGKEGLDVIIAGGGNDTVVMSAVAADVDTIDAGNANEGNTLKLTGEAPGRVDIDLSVAAGADQLFQLAGAPEALVQSDFTHVNAKDLEDFGVWVIGSKAANTIVGSDQDDFFEPGLGADVVEGGKGSDTWYVYSQAEYNGDIYTDSGTEKNDWLVFAGASGQTLTVSSSMSGVDGAAAASGLANLNINASAMLQPCGLAGNAGNNILTATRNGESIFDWGGDDKMYGGSGSDDYVIMDESYWTAGDRISDSDGADDLYFCDDSDGAMLTLTRTAVVGVERFVVSGSDLATSGPYVRDNTTTNSAGIDVSALAGPVLLAGNNGDNLLIATKGADTIKGHGGNDTIFAGLGADIVTMGVEAGSVDDIDAGALTEGNQLLLEGSPDGIVAIDLSAADQVVSIDGVADAYLQTGFLHVDASGVTAEGVDITGTAVANTLTGSGYDDVLRGGLGTDILTGGGGDDAFVFGAPNEYSAAETVSGGSGFDTVRFASTVDGQTLVLNSTNTTGIEGVAIADAAGDTSGTTALNVSVASFASAMTLTGNDGANTMTGTSQSDIFNGNGGADILNGGAGSDTYLVDAGADFVALDRISDASGSADVVRFVSTANGDLLTLSATVTGVESVELSSATGVLTGTELISVNAAAVLTGLTLRGNDGANSITGTAQADTIHGNGGNDIIAAGAGADTIHMSMAAASMDDVNAGATAEGNKLVLSGTAAGAMVWDLSSGADQLVSVNGVDEGHTMLGVTHLDASLALGGALTVTGSAEANTLAGTSLDDVFIVLAGAHITGDRIAGGGGNDILRFASTTPGETLILGNTITGIEQVGIEAADGDASGTATLGLNVALVGNALILSGNDGANAITGTAYADDIEGRLGTDTIVAGLGADIVRMQVEAADLDAADGGAITEGNTLILAGTAAGAMVVNLTVADQIVSINAVAEGLVQSGFAHVDASAVTTALSITGTAADNRLQGGDDHDTIVGGAGADTITMAMADAGIDDLDAGALSEGNTLVLVGTAAGDADIDLTAAGDQLTGINGGPESYIQTGFANVDASAMAGGVLTLTGTAGANSLTGTAGSDTIDAGAGADRVTMDVTGSVFDQIDAGGGSEGDTLVLVGAAAGLIEIDLSASPGDDQLLVCDGVGEGLVQSDFQHVDASAMSGAGVTVRGNGTDNVLIGSDDSDRFTGLAGADTLRLGLADGASDRVVYEGAADGFGSTAVAYSHDHIFNFEAGTDKVEFTAAFNGGVNDLDDITADDIFTFASGIKANFSTTHEGLFISAATAKLKTDNLLYQSGFTSVLKAINSKLVGVTAAAGDDGLIAVQAGGSTGLYYYQESDGIANKVSAGELTLLGVTDALAGAGDLILG